MFGTGQNRSFKRGVRLTRVFVRRGSTVYRWAPPSLWTTGLRWVLEQNSLFCWVQLCLLNLFLCLNWSRHVGYFRLKCPDCGFVTKHASSLGRHIASAHPSNPKQRPFICDQCPKTYKRSDDLIRHKKVSHVLLACGCLTLRPCIWFADKGDIFWLEVTLKKEGWETVTALVWHWVWAILGPIAKVLCDSNYFIGQTMFTGLCAQELTPELSCYGGLCRVKLSAILTPASLDFAYILL